MVTVDTLPHSIGEKLLAVRTWLGLTQAEVAEKANITVSYVGMLERGERLPALDVLLSLSRALGRSMSWFLSEDVEPSDSEMLRYLSPLVTTVQFLNLRPQDVLKSARVVWCLFAPKGAEKRFPV